MRVSEECWPYVISALGLALAAALLRHPIWLAFAAAGALILVFFRSPNRIPPSDASAIVAPADGRVVSVTEIDDPFVGDAKRIVIYLSLTDVHVNRSPVDGEVRFVNYALGPFHPAFLVKESEKNERNAIGIGTERGNVLVVQMAGALIRKIVCKVAPNQMVHRGGQVGLIKFGSRTDLLVPAGKTEITIKEGSRVKAGETVVARWL